MSHNEEWEEKFVRAYIVKSKRERYLSFLKSSKHRHKILARLAHALDYETSASRNLDSQFDANVIETLKSLGVSDRCYLIANGSQLDGKELPLADGVGELTFCDFGAVLICPPKPVAVYNPEDIKRLILLS